MGAIGGGLMTYAFLRFGCRKCSQLSAGLVLLSMLLVASPDSVLAAEKAASGPERLTASSGYEFERLWPQLAQQWHLDNPSDVAIDSSGNVYVTDTDNHQIKKFDSSGNFLSKWGASGSGDGQLSAPEGIGIDSSDNVYVADTGNHRIQKFDSSGTFLAKWGDYGFGDGKFNSPTDVAVDLTGDVSVVDSKNHRVQKFDSSGNFDYRWGSQGTGDGQLSSPKFIAVGPSGNVYVTDTGNRRIQKFDSGGSFISTWKAKGSLSSFGFNDLNGIAVDSGENVYAADGLVGTIQKFDSVGNFIAEWGGKGWGVSKLGHLDDSIISDSLQFSGVAVSLAGKVYVADVGHDNVRKFDSDGKLVNVWGVHSEGDGRFDHPAGIAISSSGNVLVAEPGNDRIQEFDASGGFLSKWEDSVGSPVGVAVDSSGNVFTAEPGYPAPIRKFDSSGNLLDDWYADELASASIAVDPASGHVYVADSIYSWILKFDSDGKFLGNWGKYGPGDGQYHRPAGIAVDSNGIVFVADRGNDCIHKFDSDGKFLGKWGSYGPGDGQFKDPSGIAVDPSSGNVYVVDKNNNRIQEFDSDGKFLGKWGSYGIGNGQFKNPTGVAVDSDGNVFVSDTDNGRIQKFTPLPPNVRIWPRWSTAPYGYWSKLAGIVKDKNDLPMASTRVYLQYKEGDTWKWLKTVTTNTTGYYQHWFYYGGGNRTYRARHAASGEYSNLTTPTFTKNITTWNNYRPKVKYCQWTKLHGMYGGPTGVYPNHTLYLQRWNGSRWVWQATVKTSSTGYYAAWAPVCPTTKFRMGTWGSAVTSAAVTKKGSTLTAWKNTKVHASIRDGYGSALTGWTLHLQKWNGSKWTWQGSCRTSSTGYCNFGNTVPSGTIRVATGGSRVVSGTL